MKNRILGTVFGSLLLLSPLQAVDINFTSPAFEVAVTSTSTPLTTGYTFALGSFGAFTPTSLNLANWSVNFTVVPSNGSIAWDDAFTQFSQTATLASNAGAFATTNQAYIWGYNTQTLGASTQWILLTNPSWLFPTSTNILPTNWDTSDVGTVAVFGSIFAMGNNPYLQTAVANSSPVPEPSTYAMIAGVLALGFVAWRRRSVNV